MVNIFVLLVTSLVWVLRSKCALFWECGGCVLHFGCEAGFVNSVFMGQGWGLYIAFAIFNHWQSCIKMNK